MRRVYLYSHDAEGLGHFRRNLNIASSIVRELSDCSAMLLVGSPFPSLFRLPPNCDFVKVPALQKMGQDSYRSLTHDKLSDALRMRTRVLKAVISAHPPDVLIVDKHPAGLFGELLPSLRWLRRHSPKTRIFLGLRDVLDEPAQIQREWKREAVQSVIAKFYDRVWIYGDQKVFPAISEYGFTRAVAEKSRYCGYVIASPREFVLKSQGHPLIVAGVGGGSDGYPVLKAAIEAAAILRKTYARLNLKAYAGPLMPRADLRELRRAAAPHSAFVRIERFSEHFIRHLAAADAVISMGGYNSLFEAVALGRRVVCIPRETPRMEQVIRAITLEKRGVLSVVRQDVCNGETVAKAVRVALQEHQQAAALPTLDFNGYKRIIEDMRHVLKTGDVKEITHVPL